jgi:cytochrome c5
MDGIQGKVVLGTAVLALGALLTAACSEKKQEPPPAPPPATASAQPVVATPPELQEAEKVFTRRCAMCHGNRGAGDGPMSGGFRTPPRNFQDKAWQTEVSDAHIEKIIAEGGPAVGKSPAMPPSPDLAGTPMIQGLRQYIRFLEKK